MKNFRKILSAGLALLMIMSTLVFSVSAKSFEDVPSDYKYAEQINIISDIGVTKGTSDTEYSPNAPVTREQMALLLYRLMVGNENSGRVNTTPFTDLKNDTYFGAISWAYANGFILGTSETTFEPLSGITMRDAMAMLVRILGHETDGMVKGYPWTYIDAAVKLDLDVDLEKVSYEKELTRGETAAILYNALTAEYLVPKTVVNGVTLYESTTIIEKVFGYKLAEATIVATNDFTTGSASVVVKEGFVSLSYEDNGEKLITVRYADLGLEGDANDNLGKRVKLVYSIDSAKNVKVLGATEISREELVYEGITVHEDKTDNEFDYVEIDGTRYQVVKTLSDELATNANELLVYAYSTTNELVQLESNEELHNALGIYEARVIFDDKNDTVASRIILKPYSFAQLEVSARGEYNIADGYKASELEGGFTNEAKAEDGDYVLYYYNRDNLSLDIVTNIKVASAETVNRVTDETAKIGGKTYKLGSEALGISAASIKSQLTVGEKVRIVAVNGMILAIEDGIESGAASNYLIALTNSRPVFTNGEFGYAIKVNIDGDTTDIFSDTDDVTAGKAYRYTVSDDGVYSLIPYVINDGIIVSGSDQFVQNSNNHKEMALIIDEANEAVVNKTLSNYTLEVGKSTYSSSVSGFSGEIKFVTDNNTVIVVRESDGKGDYNYSVKKGSFDGNITIENDAYVAMILDNEVGSVETLRYLYISNGAFDGSTSSANAVKILESIGSEYIDGKVYRIYNALNLDNGEVDHYYSTNASLVLGQNYKLNNDGTVSSVVAELDGGILTGYTDKTITVGATTYTLADKVSIFEIDEEFEVTSLKLASAYMSNVELVIKDDEVISIFVVGTAPMSAEYADGNIVLNCDFTFDGISDIELKSIELDGKELDISEYDVTVEGQVITVTPTAALEAGEYTVTLTLNNVATKASFTVAE